MVIGLSAGGKAVPCVFALLPDKEKITYLRVAEAIQLQLQEAEEVKVSTIMMDYERGLNTAFRSTFEGASIVGCDFHWKTLLKRRLAADGLTLLYNSDDEFQRLIRHIWALAYVPPDAVVTVWETIIQERLREGLDSWAEDWEDGIKEFIKYVDINWIGERNPRTMVRKRPAYSISMWNKHEATKQGEHRTNNLCEGFNRVFSSSVPANATVWALVDRFKEEECKARVELLQAARGHSSPEAAKSRTLKREQREAELQTLVNNYSSQPLKLFMDNMVNFFNFN
jgi:hypothetical protein